MSNSDIKFKSGPPRFFNKKKEQGVEINMNGEELNFRNKTSAQGGDEGKSRSFKPQEENKFNSAASNSLNLQAKPFNSVKPVNGYSGGQGNDDCK